jgi:hypothetical protein
MSTLTLLGDTSGYSKLSAPAVAGDQTFTLPGTGGTLDRLNRAGNVLQVVNYQTGALATGTTTIPVDDTIPQNTEGDEYMTLAITPISASSKLIIQVTGIFQSSGASNFAVALFQDSIANALAVCWGILPAFAHDTYTFSHYMTAGTTSLTTFKVRAGGSSGTVTFNGYGGSRNYGGRMASSITIWEIAA